MAQMLAPTAFAPAPRGRPTLRAAVSGLVARVAAEWRLRRDLQAVGELDGRMLQDIGIGRGGVEGAVRHGRRRTRHAASACTVAPLMPLSWTEWR